MGSCGGLQIDCLLNFCLCEAVFLPGGKTMQSLQSLARARTHAHTQREHADRTAPWLRVRQPATSACACGLCAECVGTRRVPSHFSAWLYTGRKP